MKAKLLKPSKRGLTFSLPANETYYPGQHYIYEIYKNKIIIRLAQKGMTISRKKSGNEYKALFDIRKKEVRDTVSRCSYMEMDVQTEQIVIRCIKKEQTQSKVISIERVLEEFCISSQVLSAAAGIEGQMDLFDYFGKETLNESSYTDDVKTDLRKIFTVMSLFSGAGMLDWPFAQDKDFSIRFACDYDTGACESYRRNIGNHIVCEDIRTVDGKCNPYNVLIGGPSCKPFSASNRRKMTASHEDVDLVNEYLRITAENYPDVFVIENVPQFLSCNDGEYLSRVMTRMAADYNISSTIVKDCDVGGYTTRKRAIIIGSRIGKITIPNKILHPLRTVKEALAKITPKWFNFGDLTISKPETIRNMSYVRQGHNFRDIPWLKDKPNMHSDRYFRLDPDNVSPTIVNWRKLPLIHPYENRTLTVAEASALMGFDEKFAFYGSIGSRQQQCGNGCTLAIGSLVKKAVKDALCKYYSPIPE